MIIYDSARTVRYNLSVCGRALWSRRWELALPVLSAADRHEHEQQVRDVRNPWDDRDTETRRHGATVNRNQLLIRNERNENAPTTRTIRTRKRF